MSDGSENSLTVAPRRAGQFAPGKSGNPGGRPKALTEVLEAARAEGVKSIQTLVAIRDNEKAAEAARIAAAGMLLDRGFGRATVGTPGDEGEQYSRIEFAWSKPEDNA